MAAMTSPPRIYLDNAATSWPKPPEVYAAVDEYQRQIGAPAGRGAYAPGQDVERRIAGCRRSIAQLIGAVDARRIVFGFNGTDALNIALHGLLKRGDHVVTSAAEHNSVLRPLRWLRDRGDISVAYVRCDAQGIVDPDEIAQAVTPDTRLVALTHASNVTGALQPIAEIGALLKPCGTRLLVDAAQALGHVPIDVAAMNIDLFAAPGHKGLLGPLGCGILYIAPGLEDEMMSFRQGGTGTSSEEETHPSDLPHKFEAGNLNVPGLFGLAAGVDFIQRRGIDHLRQHELQLAERLWRGLESIGRLALVGPQRPLDRVGVVSFNIEGFEPQEVAAMLDGGFNIQVRAGLHCAPRMHQAIGTDRRGGTVRMSLGPFNTEAEMDIAVAAVRQIAESAA